MSVGLFTAADSASGGCGLYGCVAPAASDGDAALPAVTLRPIPNNDIGLSHHPSGVWCELDCGCSGHSLRDAATAATWGTARRLNRQSELNGPISHVDCARSK